MNHSLDPESQSLIRRPPKQRQEVDGHSMCDALGTVSGVSL
jgi:hypothetical protein